MLELPSSGGGEIVIPDAYQKVEWVGFEGTTKSAGPNILTGDVISTRSQMEEYEIYITAYVFIPFLENTALINPILGWGSNAGLYFGTTRTGGGLIGFGANTDWTFDSDISYYKSHSYHIYWANGEAHAECEGQTCSRPYVESTGSYSLRIGTGIWADQHSGQYKIYGDVRVLKDGALIHRYVPCYRKSDGVIGFYDAVAKTFKTNAGAGSFAKGADI